MRVSFVTATVWMSHIHCDSIHLMADLFTYKPASYSWSRHCGSHRDCKISLYKRLCLHSIFSGAG